MTLWHRTACSYRIGQTIQLTHSSFPASFPAIRYSIVLLAIKSTVATICDAWYTERIYEPVRVLFFKNAEKTVCRVNSRSRLTSFLFMNKWPFIDGTPCKDDWLGYQGNCYLFSTSALTQSAAELICLAETAHLISVLTLEEITYLTDTIRGRHIHESIKYINPVIYWIGYRLANWF